jgi:hypothetical protein
MTPRTVTTGLLALATFLAVAAPARALDRPISAVKLVLKRAASGKEKLTFTSKDPAFLLPAPGGGDDPSTGTPGGATIELFSHEGTTTITIPGGTGSPGWTANLSRQSFKYANKMAPSGPSTVRSMLLKRDEALKITGRSTGLPLATAQQEVAVRITTGGLRNCTLFDTATIRKDQANAFVAADSTATGLADCSDTSLRRDGGNFTCALTSDGNQCAGTCPAGSDCGTQDFSSCVCISSAQPCGDTYAVCNGQCAEGYECVVTGGPAFGACACLPPNSTPCTQFQCGGDCPSGQECNYFERSTPGTTGCVCGPPGPCGSGGDDCPSGYHCGSGPGFTGCVPG